MVCKKKCYTLDGFHAQIQRVLSQAGPNLMGVFIYFFVDEGEGGSKYH